MKVDWAYHNITSGVHGQAATFVFSSSVLNGLAYLKITPIFLIKPLNMKRIKKINLQVSDIHGHKEKAWKNYKIQKELLKFVLNTHADGNSWRSNLRPILL